MKIFILEYEYDCEYDGYIDLIEYFDCKPSPNKIKESLKHRIKLPDSKIDDLIKSGYVNIDKFGSEFLRIRQINVKSGI